MQLAFSSVISLIFVFVVLVQGYICTQIDGYTREEIAALVKLRPLVSKFLTRDFTKDDDYLIRFLRVRDLNVESAKEMLLKNQKWRMEHKIDRILDTPLDIEKALPFSLAAIDYEMRPVGVLKMGLWDFRRLALAGKTDEVIRCIAKYFETDLAKTRELSLKTGRNITQVTAIGDVGGFSLRSHACVACFQMYVQIFSLYENNYPTMFKHAYFINAPRIFDGTVQFVKPFMSKYTRDSAHVYGLNSAEWRKVLTNIMSPEQLDLALGTKFTNSI